MGSTRLPGKSLMKIGGRTVLEHVIHRLRMCQEDLGEVIVATSFRSHDDAIAEVANRAGVECFRGHEHDVLSRFHSAAEEFEADLILRVTADCPLLDPVLVDRLITGHAGDITRIDGAPKGLGEEEIITMQALKRLWATVTPGDREHVTSAATAADYHIANLPASDFFLEHQHRRFVLDTPEDLDYLRDLYALSGGDLFEMSSREILELADTLQLA